MERFDVFVIGGGGTGSEVAFQLARRSGLRVAIAERAELGGECNHHGCVPTKAMLRSARIAAMARDAGRFGVRVQGVEVDLAAVRERVRRVIDAQSGEGPAPFERMGVRVFLQEARLTGPHRIELADGTAVEAERVVLATGTEPALPRVPGLRDLPVWTNREAIWEPERVPASLAILGAGAIGAEFAQLYARFGSRVTLVELLPQVLPTEDPDAAAELAAALGEEGIRVEVGARTERVGRGGDGGFVLSLEGGREVRAERLLVATGRRPAFDGHDLAAAGVELDARGRPLLTDTLRTTAPHVWVAGDATGELLFTHVGSYEAELVVDDILGRPRPRDYRVVPRVTFTDPEVASVGLTEAEARAAGHDVATATARLEDNERAHIDGRTHGLVKLMADRRTGELVGGHVVAEEAGAMIHEVVAAMAGRVPVRALADAIHAYPTLSESVRWAAIQLEEQVG
ncbi:MAG TPA: NAD(P)/FAD-dependent oxidoreductase [Actinomycetota bacterium]|nr:NAD(P)/FAD-dependent oxidoreductase [Actinomycetota bacterium]